MGYQDELHHKITDNGHTIAYHRLIFISINTKVLCNNISAREIWHEKWHLYVMCGTVSNNGGSILYCKDENRDHKLGIYCNLIGPLDQS